MSHSAETIGPHRVVRTLAVAPTTIVFEVADPEGGPLALKMLRAEYRDDEEHLEYLRQEFAVGSKLRHRRIIEIYEFSEDPPTPFVTMELFAQPNLKYRIREDGVERLAHLAQKIVLQSAEALGYVHAQGWLHRDIKPDNFLVTPKGSVKLIDFALAEKRRGALARLLAGKSKVQGTRSYMSPEQIRGQALDVRADIYSLGCTIYELICGRPPFTGNPDDVLARHLKSTPQPLQAVCGNVTREFADLVRRMLSKQPKGRPASIKAFLDEIQTIRVFKETPPQPSQPLCDTLPAVEPGENSQ